MAITTGFTIISQVFLLLASGPCTLVSGPLLATLSPWLKPLVTVLIIAM